MRACTASQDGKICRPWLLNAARKASGFRLLTCGEWVQIAAESGGDLKRGTRVTLFLKEDAKELCDDKKLGQLIKQYSEFIQFPIRLWQSNTKTEQVWLETIRAS